MIQNRNLLQEMKSPQNASVPRQLRLVFLLSLPSILAQLSSVIMQYIDASMVGSLGAEASASIGMVASSTWLFSGVCTAVGYGFSIQTAQSIGADDRDAVKVILRNALLTSVLFSALLALVGALISGGLHGWLGAQQEIRRDASRYFLVFAISLPAVALNRLAGSLLQSSGNMRTPGILNILMCLLDVVFNFLLIFPTRSLRLFGLVFRMPGAGFGVMGAAMGTALAQLVTALLMLTALFHSPYFRPEKGVSFAPDWICIRRAAKLSLPIAFENLMMSGALVAATRIIAPLGTVSIAANSFAVTAESLCYMPGYGISDAAATLTGQCYGAGEQDLLRRYARISAWFGIAVLTVTGTAMFFAAPLMLAILTPVVEVRSLGASVLRIEAFAEPLYGASMVCSGALRGVGDTLVPSLMNMGSIWIVRLSLSLILVGPFGLYGVWIAMCTELCFRGLIFLFRLYREPWRRRNEKSVRAT